MQKADIRFLGHVAIALLTMEAEMDDVHRYHHSSGGWQNKLMSLNLLRKIIFPQEMSSLHFRLGGNSEQKGRWVW